MTQSQPGAASGAGNIKRRSTGEAFSQGGIVSGTGYVTRANGEIVHFVLTSEPLTQEQADALNNQIDIKGVTKPEGVE